MALVEASADEAAGRIELGLNQHERIRQTHCRADLRHPDRYPQYR
jgi:hypothetical protein